MKKILLLCIMLISGVYSNAQTAIEPSSGTGTSEDPYAIASMENLYWLCVNSTVWGDHFIQTSNIDASVSSEWEYGWTQMIGGGGNYFTGSYDGQDHSIRGLHYNGPTYWGLFAMTDGAIIANIHLTELDIQGGTYVGGLVGKNKNSTIENSSVSGSISGVTCVGGLAGESENSTLINCHSVCSVSGTSLVGGLTGKNYQSSIIKKSSSCSDVSGTEDYVGGLTGANDDSSLIDTCYSSGTVQGGITYIGGLVGINDHSSVIKHSYSDVTVSGNGNYVGGLAGGIYFYTIIDSCYSRCAVNGNDYVGGLTGFNDHSEIRFSCSDGSVDGMGEYVGGFSGMNRYSTINNCYSNGSSAGGNYVAGFIGYNQFTSPVGNSYCRGSVTGTGTDVGGFTAYNDYSESIANCFWNIETSGIDSSDGGVGMSSQQMKNEINFTNSGWNFTGIWITDGLTNEGFPYLRWQQNLWVAISEETSDDHLIFANSYSMDPVYPNPCNPIFTIPFLLHDAKHVDITIYDISGNKMMTILDMHLNSGEYDLQVTTDNLVSGIYFLQTIFDQDAYTQKLLIIK